ncbi:MAG: hypothetical protein V1797_04570 [Pseudomonadota bacterium]
MNGRKRETQMIRRANRMSAVGRLMLGELKSWREFLDADVIDLESMPRKNLKSGKYDIQNRLSDEIRSFCTKNFANMTERKLEILYEAIKEKRGLEIPLTDFEKTYSPIRPQVLKDTPPYSTVIISLWGLKFRHPEYFLTNDIIQSLSMAVEARNALNEIEKKTHVEAHARLEEIVGLQRKEGFACRSIILSCYNLLEAYLNGLAWVFALDKEKMSAVSNNARKLIEDSGQVSLKEKVVKYPKIISGSPLWGDNDDPPKLLLTDLKQFRDSLVHPSPFSVPERFGGYDKLQTFYLVDIGVSMITTRHTVGIISHIHEHINGASSPPLKWLNELSSALVGYEDHFNELTAIN